MAYDLPASHRILVVVVGHVMTGWSVERVKNGGKGRSGKRRCWGWVLGLDRMGYTVHMVAVVVEHIAAAAVEGSKVVAVIQAVKAVVEDPALLAASSKVDASTRAEKAVFASPSLLLPLLLHHEDLKVVDA